MAAQLHSSAQRRARELATQFAAFPQVAAVALGGSQVSDAADADSDIDLYVYTRAEIPLAARATLIEQAGGAIRANLSLPYWGAGDLWIDAATGITVDSMYFDVAWMDEQITRVVEAHQASLGYSTCFWRTVRQSRVLYDPRGWFQALQRRSQQDYPEALRRNIIAHNHPVLRTIMPSYLHQIENAVRRDAAVSVNHRVAALLASYFDIVFALNRVLHPGEKRLIALVHSQCTLLPTAMEADVAAVLAAAGTASDGVVAHLRRLLDRLDELLIGAGFDPQIW
jgi:uncharacterized protein DUF4037/nucleotidyltransferase-like protein